LFNYCSGKEQKLYVIIDEYDNFANSILSTVGEKAFEDITHGTGFLRAFFNVLKAGTSDTDAPVSRLFMTGVSPITLDDVTSGFNIATNISLEPDLNSMLGFTREEVIQLVDYYRDAGIIHHPNAEILDIMETWYNHYRFSIESDIEVFNTVHILYFIQQYMFRSKIPTDFIDTNARVDYEKLRHLVVIDKKGVRKTNGNFSKLQQILENQEIKTTIKKSFPVSELHLPGNFVSLLYYFGLLTIRGIDEEDSTILAIPNESVKHLYYDFIKAAYEETGALAVDTDEYLSAMKDMAFRGKWQPLVKYIAQRMEASLGLRDLMTGEKAMQVFWNVYLGLSTYYTVYIEKEMNQGFADIVMVPLLNQHANIKYAYLWEIKYVKPSEKKKGVPQKVIDSLKEKAAAQLNTYEKDERFLKTIGQTTLKKMVLVFSGNRLVSDIEV
ncbi:MAG: AAA family ATPase, partial [Candidatus Omnitrophota bacterium]